MSRNQVLFKGRDNGIVVVLDTGTSFEALKDSLAEKLVDAKEFLGDSTTSISFEGKVLSGSEENELLRIISRHSNINIAYIEENELKSKGEKQGKTPFPKEKYSPGDVKEIRETYLPENIFSPRENQTLYHQGSLRSGQSIEYSGTVVIIGDVNPGAEIIAKGHVIVLGSLKGLVHAGCLGMEDAFVVALNLEPIQLRIGSVYTYIPEDKHGRGFEPSMAFVEDGKIYVRIL